jgi:hypothetical protein
MPGKSTGQVIGYKYFMGMHMVLCQKIDALLGVTVGDRILWGWGDTVVTAGSAQDPFGYNFSASFTNPGPAQGADTDTYAGFTNTGLTASGDYQVSRPELFGGDAREGGIEGTIGLLFGEDTQGPDPYLQQFFGAYTPAFRGVVSVILKRCYIGVNPYLKNWAFLVRRVSLKDKASASIQASDTQYDANPAYIIWECITDADFGMGYPDTVIDQANFDAAALTLKNEGFGLSFIWDQQSRVEEFIQEVLNHINGVLYVDLTTGKFKIKLIRADYNIANIPGYDESNIIEIESYQRAGWGETVNEIVAQYTDRYTGNTASVTVQDLANMQIQQCTISMTKRYAGITDPNLAARVAQRDLLTFSTPLSKLKFKVNRKAWNLRAGDVFKLSWVKLGVSMVVFRVGAVSQGTLLDGTITVEAVEDVFALPAATYMTHENPTVIPPATYPIQATRQRIIEANFWDVMKVVGTNSALNMAPTAAFAIGVAAKPASNAGSFLFETSAVSNTGPFEPQVIGHFSPTCTLPYLPREDVSVVNYTNDADMHVLTVGSYGYIDDEAVSVAAIDTSTKTITLNRGLLDTTPAVHNSGDVFFMDFYRAANHFEYAAGEDIRGVIRPQFSLGTLDRSKATVMSHTMAGRPYRPYPPGNLKLNGVRFPAQLSHLDDLVITWAHRNRAQQTAYMVKQNEGNIGPEAGVSYKVSIANSIIGDLLLDYSVDGTETSATFTASNFQQAAIAEGYSSDLSTYVGSTMTVEVKAIRDGYYSWQSAKASFTLT